ncbi:MAG: 3-ketoacyl-ACP reductase FabG2 [SAR324 cluster bacterium]|jgi:3-oxoacyl-[acyl-carrier protein] reductase|nr:3-oxoacyl-ACP reductase FabG [SAR324 cluster bacterium]MCH2270362.1 3-ketoacyl-ACP reductase FabG2 [SAR324 cluster bacterium]HIM43593.1 3-oxoacyl-ACP reductase FabG [Deltaproteobacteria bacterium]HIO61481.1 3-oxoacyl-ACP reductase FabG [Deltaproteobacteria bacterium]|tara:strand:- start:1589 stop:2314 length:726 start_codon:yes stop_codon:yes gene_type:complete
MKKRVLVTGSSRGIGRAVVLELSSAGFEVVLNYKSNHTKAKEVLEQIQSKGGCASLLPFDVSNRAVARKSIEENAQEFGTFYGAVCNAGITADAAFPALSGEDWDVVIHTNLDGFYNVLHPLVMPMILAKKGGRIVTLSSISALAGNPGQVNYGAAKAGIIGATRALAQELAKRKITANCVAPGLIETDMLAEIPLDEAKKRIPMRRLGKPEEVAGLVCFLFSEKAAYITGQVISVNGGML